MGAPLGRSHRRRSPTRRSGSPLSIYAPWIPAFELVMKIEQDAYVRSRFGKLTEPSQRRHVVVAIPVQDPVGLLEGRNAFGGVALPGEPDSVDLVGLRVPIARRPGEREDILVHRSHSSDVGESTDAAELPHGDKSAQDSVVLDDDVPESDAEFANTVRLPMTQSWAT